MTRACIAIVDAARARIYTYDPAQSAERGPATGQPDHTLHEELDLVNPGRRGHDLFSTTKPGIKRPGSGGGTTDDHRDAHLDELEHRFARQVVEQVDRIARQRTIAHVILVAAPRMIGELCGFARVLQRSRLEVEYVERDLARLSSPQIHDHLAQLRLIAPRPRATLAPR